MAKHSHTKAQAQAHVKAKHVARMEAKFALKDIMKATQEKSKAKKIAISIAKTMTQMAEMEKEIVAELEEEMTMETEEAKAKAEAEGEELFEVFWQKCHDELMYYPELELKSALKNIWFSTHDYESFWHLATIKFVFSLGADKIYRRIYEEVKQTKKTDEVKPERI